MRPSEAFEEQTFAGYLKAACDLGERDNDQLRLWRQYFATLLDLEPRTSDVERLDHETRCGSTVSRPLLFAGQ